MTYEIDCNDYESKTDLGAFYVDKPKGSIMPDEEVHVLAMFNPPVEGRYSQKIPVFLNGFKEKAFTELFMSGIGQRPLLLFDR